MLKEYYSAVQNISYYKDPAHFKTASKDEEIRRNNITKCVESYQEKLNFILSDNDAAVGRFLLKMNALF